MRRLWLVGVAVVFAACGAVTARAVPSVAASVTLASWASSPAESALLAQVVSAFEASHPEIRVNVETIGGDYQAELEARFAAHHPPDVFFVDASYAQKWIGLDALTPLNTYIRASALDTGAFFDRLLAAFTGRGDGIYALPKDWSPLALYGNDGLLAAAGVAAPASWAQLEAAAQQLAASGVTPLCIAPSWTRLMAFVYQNGGGFLSADGRSATVTTPAVAQAIAFAASLFNRGWAKTPAQLGVGWCGEAFANGRVAMTLEGNWLAPFLNAFPQLHYTINPLPVGARAGNVAFTVGYAIAQASANKQAAWELVSFLTGREGMTMWTQGGLALPARDDVPVLPGRAGFMSQADLAQVWQFPAGFEAVPALADEQLAAVLAGSQTVDGMLAAIQAAAESALKATAQTTPPPSTPPAAIKPLIAAPTARPRLPAAGKPFSVSFPVRRSDNSARMPSGTIIATASIGGTVIRHTHRFRNGLATLTLVVPKGGSGKLLKITLTIKNGAYSTTRTASFRIS